MATPVPLCTHVKPSGATCGSPAVSGTALCYHHSAVKSALAKVVPLDQVPHGAHAPLPFVFPEDRASIQINFFLLLKAFNEKRIDQRTATIMHRMLRAMSANLGAKPLTEDRAEATAPPTSAPSTAPDADPIKPSCSGNIAGNVSPSHEQPAPGSTSKVRKSAPGTASPTSQHPPLPGSSHGPTLPSIDPSSVFSAVYPPRNASADPLNQTDQRHMGVLSPEGQRILSMFSSQRD
jgi:hypothetical protein